MIVGGYAVVAVDTCLSQLFNFNNIKKEIHDKIQQLILLKIFKILIIFFNSIERYFQKIIQKPIDNS